MYLNLPKYPRYITAALGSFFVTGGLVYLMVQLVAIDDVELTTPVELQMTEIVRLLEDEPVVIKTPEIEKPPQVEDEPPPPLLDIASNDTGGVGLDFTPPVKGKPTLHAFAGLTDGEHIPVVKVAPQYPRRAITQGLEGYVILSFTITPAGATADPVVIESHPGSVFDKSAINAVRKFKYRPKVVDGEAQPVYDVQHRLTYELARG